MTLDPCKGANAETAQVTEGFLGQLNISTHTHTPIADAFWVHGRGFLPFYNKQYFLSQCMDCA